METRWGTFTDPWTLQPQPKCGFVVVGTEGTIASYDYENHVTVQTRARPQASEVPNDPLHAPHRAPVEYLLHCLQTGAAVTGPLAPALSRTGQRIVDTAHASARAGRTLPLVGQGEGMGDATGVRQPSSPLVGKGWEGGALRDTCRTPHPQPLPTRGRRGTWPDDVDRHAG